MLGTAQLTIDFKTTIKDTTWEKPTMIAAKRIHDVKMSVVSMTSKTKWRLALRRRFYFVPRYGHLLVKVAWEGTWREDIRELFVTETRFQDNFDDPDWLHNFMEMLRNQVSRIEERHVMRCGRMWCEGSRGGYVDRMEATVDTEDMQIVRAASKMKNPVRKVMMGQNMVRTTMRVE